MTSESTDLASTKISEKMEDRRVIRDLRLKKNIVKNREKKKKKFSVKCAKSEYNTNHSKAGIKLITHYKILGLFS